jgi:hypothetical protein
MFDNSKFAELAQIPSWRAYGNEPKVRSDFPEAGYYVQFDGVKPDIPASLAVQNELGISSPALIS